MENLTIEQCYQLLGVNASATDDEITSAFRKLALKYHPDRNRNKEAWANEVMARLNHAYSFLISNRFQREEQYSQKNGRSVSPEQQRARQAEEAAREREQEAFNESLIREHLIREFVSLREDCKQALYGYFQYGLHNLARRDASPGASEFKSMVRTLRRCYHRLQHLAVSTKETDLIEHFQVFNQMIFSFYRACECLNVNDSYKNLLDVEAYRTYKQADEMLHDGHREVFYDRHNRGQFRQAEAVQRVRAAGQLFHMVIDRYPASSWVVEAGIKLEYTLALMKYIDLFFSEEE